MASFLSCGVYSNGKGRVLCFLSGEESHLKFRVNFFSSAHGLSFFLESLQATRKDGTSGAVFLDLGKS